MPEDSTPPESAGVIVETVTFLVIGLLVWTAGWAVDSLLLILTPEPGNEGLVDLGDLLPLLQYRMDIQHLLWIPVVALIAALTRRAGQAARFALYVIAAVIVALAPFVVAFATRGPQGTPLTVVVITEDVLSFGIAALLAAFATPQVLSHDRRTERIVIVVLLSLSLASLAWTLTSAFERLAVATVLPPYIPFEQGSPAGIAFLITGAIAVTAAAIAILLSSRVRLPGPLVASVTVEAIAIVTLVAAWNVYLPW